MKKFLIGLGAFVVLLVLVSFILPGHCHIERRKVIAASPDKVYSLVANPKAWNQWAAWQRRDPNMQQTFTGPEIGQGAGYSWKSESQGDGKMEFDYAVPNDTISSKMYFMGEDDPAFSGFKFKPSGAGTEVLWTMDSDMGMNPMWRWMGLFMDNMVGKDYEQGLAGLDAVATGKPVPAVE